MASQTVTPAERIRELGAINADVATLLESAGHAITALTNQPVVTSSGEADDAQMASDAQSTVQSRKDVFKDSTKQYYTGLQAVIARLRRQAYALEEAGIIAAEPQSLSSTSGRPANGQPATANRAPGSTVSNVAIDAITNSGLGNFDVGWLNSRGNKVGADKEAELVQEAKELLDTVLSKNS